MEPRGWHTATGDGNVIQRHADVEERQERSRLSAMASDGVALTCPKPICRRLLPAPFAWTRRLPPIGVITLPSLAEAERLATLELASRRRMTL